MGGGLEHEFRSLVNPHLLGPSALVRSIQGDAGEEDIAWYE